MSWTEIELGDEIDIKHGFAFKSQFFSDSGKYILLTPGNCYERGGLKLKGEKEKFYVGEIPEEYVLSTGDMIVVMTDLVATAPILGGAFIVPEDDRFLHNQRLGLVTQKTKNLDNRFLYYLLNTESYRAQVRGSASGATVRHTAPKRIYRCRARVPDKTTQIQIAGILSAYDDLIENNKRRIALLEQAARELYREWFVRLRFPGHEHTKVIEGIPEGWELKTLGDVADTNVESYRAKELPDELNYIDISSVSAGQIVEKKRMISAEAPGRARRKAKHGDVIWSNVRPNLKAYSLVMHPNVEDVFSTGFTILSARDVPFTFLYQHVTTDQFVSYLVNQTTGASYPAVRPDDFERAEVVVPAAPLLEEFHTICEPTYELITRLTKQNRDLAQARDLLLPRLMDGRISV